MSFYKRLRELGFRNYRKYLTSNYWKKAKKRYSKTGLPKYCLACGNKRFNLHHRSYARLGEELPRDLIPLCKDCHWRVHQQLKVSKTKLEATHVLLRQVFGWSRSETSKKFRPFSISRKGFRWINKNRKSPKKKLKREKRKKQTQLERYKFLQAEEIRFNKNKMLAKK